MVASLRQLSKTTLKGKKREREKNSQHGSIKRTVIHHSSDVPIHPLLPLIFFNLESRYEGGDLDSAVRTSTESFHTTRDLQMVQDILEDQRSLFNRNRIVVLCIAAGVTSGTFFFFSCDAFCLYLMLNPY